MKIESVIWAFMLLISGLGPGWCALSLGISERCFAEILMGAFMITTGVIFCVTFLWAAYAADRR